MTQPTIPEEYTPGEESAPENDTRNYIVYRIPKIVDGVQITEDHRIPMEERAAFEAEHGL